MTAADRPAVWASERSEAPAPGRGALLAALLRQRVRRDRWQLLIWLLCIGLLAVFSAASIDQTYGSAQGRAEVIRLAIANPAILVLRGLPQGTSMAAVTFFQIYCFLALLAGLMNTFLAVRHSRAEEESGRAELIEATPAGRLLPTVATIGHGLLADIALALVTALGFAAAGLPLSGSFAAGAAVGGVGIAFLAIGLLLSQLMSTARAANGYSAALVVFAYVLRGIGDATGTVSGQGGSADRGSADGGSADGVSMVPAWPSWLSPIGWGQQVSPFVRDDWRPLLLHLGFAALLIAAVFALQAARDSGAGVFAARAGRRDALPTLSGPFGLAWRLQWPVTLGWTAGGLATGALAGALGSVVNSSAANDPSLANIRNAIRQIGPGGSGPLTQLFLSAILSIVGVLAAACAVQAVIRLRQEEAGGFAEPILAAPVSRVRWLSAFVLVGVISIVSVLLAAALAAGLSAIAAGEDMSLVNDSFAAAAAQFPVALVCLAVLTLIFAALPRWTAPVSWSALGLGAFAGIFGGLLRMPDWLRHLSPFANAPVVVGEVDWTGGFWMFGIALVALAAAAVVFQRRDCAVG